MADTTFPNDLNPKRADAFNAGDLPLLMTMYEADAVLVPGPGADPIQGHDAIEAALQRFLNLGGQLHFTPRHWLVQGDLAMGSIAFTMEGGHDPDGNPVPLTGTTAEVARRHADAT